MSGLDAEQLDELEELVSELLEDPRDKGNGRLRELTLREALIVASGYVRNNITEEIWAEIFDVDQSTISWYITYLTPLTGKATAGVPAIRGGSSKPPGARSPWYTAPCGHAGPGRASTSCGPGNTGQRATDQLIITNLAGHITVVSAP